MRGYSLGFWIGSLGLTVGAVSEGVRGGCIESLGHKKPE